MPQILKLTNLSLLVLISLLSPRAIGSEDVRLVVVKRHLGPVLTVHNVGAEGNKYGFEGGRVVKIRQTYHLVYVGDGRRPALGQDEAGALDEHRPHSLEEVGDAI